MCVSTHEVLNTMYQETAFFVSTDNFVIEITLGILSETNNISIYLQNIRPCKKNIPTGSKIISISTLHGGLSLAKIKCEIVEDKTISCLCLASKNSYPREVVTHTFSTNNISEWLHKNAIDNDTVSEGCFVKLINDLTGTSNNLQSILCPFGDVMFFVSSVITQNFDIYGEAYSYSLQNTIDTITGKWQRKIISVDCRLNLIGNIDEAVYHREFSEKLPKNFVITLPPNSWLAEYADYGNEVTWK